MYETITVEKRGKVAVLTINRPDKLNALSSQVHTEGVAALDELRGDESVRVLVITGAGEKAFIAGADISEFEGQTPVTQRNAFHERSFFNSIDTFPKPVIAMIKGFCLGGGNELAMACDLRMASENARFSQPEINLGIMCGGGGTQRLPRLVGEGRAMELALTGDMIDAATAERFGLVNHVYSSDQDAITKMTALGALVTVNHPNGAPDWLDAIDPPPHSIEIYNNSHALTDEGIDSTTHYIAEFRAVWDHLLEFRSARVWGVAVNDWAGAWTPLGLPSVPGWPLITERSRDRGKLEVLVTSYDLEAYTNAFRYGAFFAIVEDNAIKSAYPVVSNITVTPASVAITTVAGTETVQWIGNGAVVAFGSTLSLSNLPAGLKYVRAEIDDGEGRTVFSQPFSLAALVLPPPPAAPVPVLPEGALLFLGIALLGLGRRRRGARQLTGSQPGGRPGVHAAASRP